MSGDNGTTTSRPHHASHSVVRVAAAIILLALGACSSNSTVNTSGQPTPSVASFGVSGQRATLAGAGSTGCG